VDDDWSLDGYEVQGPIGDGAGEDLWRAREISSGDVVVLCRLPEDVRQEEVAAWQQQLARLQAVRSPHLVRLRAVVEQNGRAVLVRDHVTGGGLAELASRRGHLEPGEVVTLGVALAQALGALHDAGLVAGGLPAENVLFRSDGMPMLTTPAPSGPPLPDPGEDVGALAALCARLVGPTAPAELAAVLTRARSGGFAARELGAALRRCCPPAPVRRGAAPAAAPPPPPQARAGAGRGGAHAARRAFPALLVGALVLLGLAGALAGWWSVRSGDGSSVRPHVAAPTVSPGPGSAREWAALLDELDAARATALAQADDELLTAVYAPSSPGLAADRRLVRELGERGLHARGVRHTVSAVHVVRSSVDRATLRVVDALAAYELLDGEGEVVERAAGRGQREHVVHLERTAGGWRLSEVRPG
jgi:hypothetical protein